MSTAKDLASAGGIVAVGRDPCGGPGAEASSAVGRLGFSYMSVCVAVHPFF